MVNRWAVITGAGTGIGAALSIELARHGVHILAIGRRLNPLENTKEQNPSYIHVLQADIGTKEGIESILNAIPEEDDVSYLVQNAAVGDPAKLGDIQQDAFELALRVNVTAPLMLTQGFLSRLSKSHGRICHLGTGVVYQSQVGTATYGITKMAFHKLYEQLLVECPPQNVGICNILPGMVDTEGVWDHYEKAKKLNLEHTKYFDIGKENGDMISPAQCAKFIRGILMEAPYDEYSKQWSRKSHWDEVMKLIGE